MLFSNCPQVNPLKQVEENFDDVKRHSLDHFTYLLLNLLEDRHTGRLIKILFHISTIVFGHEPKVTEAFMRFLWLKLLQ